MPQNTDPSISEEEDDSARIEMRSVLTKLEKNTESLVRDEIITIALEGHHETFSVSKALLCSSSPYFEKALGGGFAEARDRRLSLPGCDATTLRLFLSLLAGNVNYYEFGNILGEPPSPGFRASKWVATEKQLYCVRLWAFGDAYLVPRVRHYALVCLQHISCNNYVWPKAARLAFEVSPTDSDLRNTLVRAVFDRRKCYCEEEMDEYGAIPGFLFAFSKLARQTD